MTGPAGWPDRRRFLVAGTGVAGAAAAEVLLGLGAAVTIIDRTGSETLTRLGVAGAETLVADTPPAELLARIDDVVVSPGFAPHSPLVQAAVAAGRPVYSEPELAWRLRGPGAAPWLALTGTNGKTTTTTMLAAILRAAGQRTAALGNIGEPLVFVALDPARYDVLAVELSSQQLHWSSTLAPAVGAWLNLADDHLEWHGGFAAYAQAKLAIWRSAAAGGVAIGNLDDPAVAAALAQLPPERAVGVTLGEPGPGQLGVVDGQLVDRAFGDGVPLAPADGIRPPGPHNVSNALHAAALARAYGVPPAAVGRRAGRLPARAAPQRAGVHSGWCRLRRRQQGDQPARGRRLAAGLPAHRLGRRRPAQERRRRATWSPACADRLVGAVLLGVDRAEVAAALARHAPDIPVVDVARTDDGAMVEVVAAAAALARPGDTVLLAPAAASKDMFISYAAPGRRVRARRCVRGRVGGVTRRRRRGADVGARPR